MRFLVTTALALFASHAVLSAPRVRPALIGRLGRGGFRALYSSVSTVTLALFLWAYVGFEENRLLYPPLPQAGRIAVFLMPLAFVLVSARFLTRSGEPAAPLPPRGIYRITRHPGSIGLLIWAGLHLAATGDIKRVALFATMAAIALFAIIKNEWMLRNVSGAAAQSVRTASSVVPFGAIIAGRQRLVAREIGWRIPFVALIAYGAMLLAHPYLFAVDPLDWFRWGDVR